ncbi:Hemolysin secretion protein D, chromosomal [Sporomusa ovata DSM 2662]|uniref:HlyD family secretion protein n=1 Tax=Sporomusa ovata TaxID=2378 RepID=A0A0U1L4S3_9FIRM|nr:HlyD family type I secretion periplasmic adaptor subunit [Sporomusa ovata]EQB26113.1 hemolysin secretion protein D, chromosomal [Sporomusa ovata DSM 2662]CQR74688.1 HlyD family secretion protein [Sporomusa ovata]
MFVTLAKLFRRRNKGQLNKTETEFLPAVMEVTETPPSPIGRSVLWTLFALVIVGLLWSVLGQVDEVAIAPGKIIPAGYVKTIQAEDKGVVKDIYVHDGEKVKQGQLLLELNPTFSAADLARLKKQVAFLKLEIERLTAERDGVPFTAGTQPDIDANDLAFHMSLYQSRMSALTAKITAAESNIEQSQASLEVARVNKIKLAGQYDIAKDSEERIEKLNKDNAISLFTVLEYRGKRMEIEQNMVAQDSEIARRESALGQARAQLASILADNNRDITTKLVDDRRQLQDYIEQLKKAQETDNFSRMVSPVDGRVTQLSVHTIGGVVTAAQPLMVIVPEDVQLEVEAWIANKDIGFIQLAQRAEVKVETFTFQKYGTIDGEVVEISPDAVEDKDKGRVYRVALSLDKDKVIVNDHEVYLGPGMSVTAEIKIRQKRIIEFFLDPFRQYQSEGLRER